MSNNRTNLQKVRVIDIADDGTYAVVETVHRTHIEVSMNLRHAKGAWPQIGEIWLISKQYGTWIFAAVFSDGKPPVVHADRTKSDDLAVHLLDTLVGMGLVREDGAEDDFSGNDYNDADLNPGALNTIEEGDDPVAPADVDVTEVVPTALWLGTYNTQGASLGNKALLGNLRRLLAAPGDVWALQEVYNGQGGPGYRDPVQAYLESKGYAVYRDESISAKEWLWLTYRTDRIEMLDSGMVLLTDWVSTGSGIPRYAQWATLRHLASGQRFSVINVAYSPPARFTGSIYTTQVSGTNDLMTTLNDQGPVYIVGSMNVNQRDSGDNTHSGWPKMVFEAAGATSNWTVLGLPSSLGTYGLPLADYVWQGPDEGQIGTLKEQRILRGFTTRHRPLLVRIQMKRKDTDLLR